MKNIFKFSKFNENIAGIFRRKETVGERWKIQLAEYGLVIKDLKNNVIDLSNSTETDCKIYYKDYLITTIRTVKDKYYYYEYLICDYYVYESLWIRQAFFSNYKDIWKREWKDGLFVSAENELKNQIEKPVGKVRFEANPSKRFNDQKFELIQHAFLAFQGTTKPGYTEYSKYFRSKNN